VAVRVIAAGLNSRDPQIVHGIYPTDLRPLVPVGDYCGEVVEVGEGVTRASVGDRVIGVLAQDWVDGPFDPATWFTTMGAHRDGAMRERVVVGEHTLVPAPAHLSDQEAAALSGAGVSAWNATIDVGRPRPGDNVLIQGVGGVASFAIQFARVAGARVIVTTRTPSKIELARTLGAHDVVDITEQPDWPNQVRELTGGEGAEVIIELYGDLEGSLGALRSHGTIVQVGYMANLRTSADVIPMMLTNVRLRGIAGGSGRQLREMCRALELHGLRPPLDRSFAFDELPDALRYVESGAAAGKVVITF
jgi:NADPH:quinone reductase-like Zn-dependent oxidoreductase